MESIYPSTNVNKPNQAAGGSLASRPRPQSTGAAQQQQDLDQYRGAITRMLIDENLSLNEVMEVMEKDYNVTAS